jgi:DNA-binding beta-propeller fold protein YncE
MLERLKVFRLGSALLMAATLALVGCSNSGDDLAPAPAPAPVPVPVPVPGVTYTVGGTVSGLTGTGLVLQNNNASDLAVAGNGAFTFATPVVVGASYSVTVKTQPSGQTCSVGNGSGTSTGANVTNVTVTCISKQFAYVANQASNNVSAYTINAATGELTAIGSPVAAGTNPYSIAIDPRSKFAYVANQASNNVSAYTINAATGELTAIGSPVPAGSGPVSIVTTKF